MDTSSRPTIFLAKVADELNRKLATQEVPKPDGAQDLYAKEPLHWLFSNLRTITGFYKEKTGEFFSGLPRRLMRSPARKIRKATQKEEGPSTAAKLLKLLSVKIIPRTQIIQIQSTHPDPHQAALIANTVAATFIKERLNRRLAATNQAIQWLQNQLKHEQTELDTTGSNSTTSCSSSASSASMKAEAPSWMRNFNWLRKRLETPDKKQTISS